ncbi:MAG: phospho-N-acetylmuramoyl-pentapeptide-transferase [Myxococcota bacterium]
MLYHLLTPLADDHQFFNLFRYISFRAAWAMVTALAICYTIFPWFINYMKNRRMEQIIRKDGPQEHIENKVGTPTMGGLPMVLSITISTLLWARLDQPVVWMALTVMLGYGLLGFIDDWKKVMLQSSDGLSGRWKLVGQFGIGGAVLAWGYLTGVISPELALPFLKNSSINFGTLGVAEFAWFYVVFGMIVLTGTSNAVNLTDGLDGLAIGPVMTSALTFSILAYIAGNTKFSGYLSVPYVPGAGELTVFAVAMVGAGLGFLWYNTYPAQIFMGDVGSLSLGGALGILAILTKNEILLVLVGGIFVLEAVSVILQVGSFKLRGKRIFAMAPIHHHYEKKGWSEPKIIVRFWIISILLALVALTTLKVR